MARTRSIESPWSTQPISSVWVGLCQGTTDALVRDALLALMRITDAASGDKLTLCRVSKLLDQVDLREERIADARNWIPGSHPQLADADAKTCAAAIAFVSDLVPPQWDRAPKDTRLLDLRSRMRPVRDAVLAHSLDTAGLAMPVVNELRALLHLVSELVQRTELIFRGSTGSWERDYKNRLKEATEFWDLCQTGVIEGVRCEL